MDASLRYLHCLLTTTALTAKVNAVFKTSFEYAIVVEVQIYLRNINVLKQAPSSVQPWYAQP